MKIIKHIIIVLTAAVLFAGCAQNDTMQGDDAQPVDSVSEATLARYDVREIHDYQGIQLDPAVGPRDNSIVGIQYVDIDDYSLEITGLVEAPQTLAYDDVLAMDAHERVITLYCVEGWDATLLWKGVRITDLIDMASPQPEATNVIFECVDGYTTSIPLSTIEERDMLLAYEANTAPLPPQMGYPFIVVAEDKLGYKWARWVMRIILSDEDNYKGYWERRGFENDAEVAD